MLLDTPHSTRKNRIKPYEHRSKSVHRTMPVLTKCIFIRAVQMFQISFDAGVKSFPAIFQRIANPVQPFGFVFVQDSLLLPLPDGIRDGFWNHADLLHQLDNSHINQF
jgi:hypothetical protein